MLFSLIIIANLAFAADSTDEFSADKYDIFYKNGKSGGTLEKLNLDKVNLQNIFSVDLRKDENFLKAIDNSILFYTNILDTDATFKYGEQEYTPAEMIDSLVKFKSLVAKDVDYQKFLGDLATMFNVYEAKNNKDKAILTGYYTPHILVLNKKTKSFAYPILVESGSKKTPKFFAKSSRDLYDLRIEGAGIIELPDGQNITIEYAGRKHIGKLVKIYKKQKNMKLAKGKKSKRTFYTKRVIKLDAPYFRITNGGPFGWADVPLTPKYTAAIDRDLAPMGGLMYIKSTQNLENVDSVLTTHPEFNAFEGFMLAQDIGSAIKGGGRVDIYCGDSPVARHSANSISRVGAVYLIVAKKDSIEEKIDRRAQLQ